MYESLNNNVFRSMLISYINSRITKEDLEAAIPELDRGIADDAREVIETLDSSALIPPTIMAKL